MVWQRPYQVYDRQLLQLYNAKRHSWPHLLEGLFADLEHVALELLR